MERPPLTAACHGGCRSQQKLTRFSRPTYIVWLRGWHLGISLHGPSLGSWCSMRAVRVPPLLVPLESTTLGAKRGASASRNPPRLEGGGGLRWAEPPPCPGPATRPPAL
eukprot:3070957-Pyramimonas_sp.AAC.1